MSLEGLFIIIELGAAGVVAVVLLPNSLADVGLGVDVKVVLSTEPLRALLALEGLFTSMDLLVPFEVRYLKVSDGMNVGPVPV